MLVNQLAPVPKSIFSDDEYAATFYPVALSDLSRGGNYYGIPLEIDGLLLFYNDRGSPENYNILIFKKGGI